MSVEASRRALLTGAAAAAVVAATATGARAGTADTGGACAGPVVRTTAGLVGGVVAGRTAVFRGVPYAEPPVGRLRFASPRPPRPWRGVRDATRFAAPSYQSALPGSSEDSLYANVWTPDTGGRRPVLVYVHGGGWFLGAGSQDVYDGERLADRGDLVVVTFNYRLGGFGWGSHPDLADPDTGSHANWGLQDQVALLHWVRANARAFGGDPDNITLAGDWPHGASTWQLSLLPELRSTVRRIVPISAAHAWAPALALTAQDSVRAYDRLAGALGTSVAGLRDADAARIKAAWEATFTAAPSCARWAAAASTGAPSSTAAGCAGTTTNCPPRACRCFPSTPRPRAPSSPAPPPRARPRRPPTRRSCTRPYGPAC